MPDGGSGPQPPRGPSRLTNFPYPSPKDLGFGRLFHAIRDAVVVADVDHDRIVLWNPAAIVIFGYSVSQALDTPLHALVAPPLRDKHFQGIARYRTTGHGNVIDSRAPVEVRAVRKDGVEIAVELTLTPLKDVDFPGTYVMALIRDVSHRKR